MEVWKSQNCGAIFVLDFWGVSWYNLKVILD
jgi:hypothetical protein